MNLTCLSEQEKHIERNYKTLSKQTSKHKKRTYIVNNIIKTQVVRENNLRKSGHQLYNPAVTLDSPALISGVKFLN